MDHTINQKLDAIMALQRQIAKDMQKLANHAQHATEIMYDLAVLLKEHDA